MKNNKTDYAQKLQDPRWQRKRLEVMQAAGWKCVICGDKDEELNVHHPAYSANCEPWDYPRAQLECLCKTCHTIQHLPKDKLMIHARSMVTEHILVTHEQQFLSGMEGLMRSMLKHDPKYVAQLFTIRGEALAEYDSLKANTDARVESVIHQYNEDQSLV
jgi:hypothetical protein